MKSKEDQARYNRINFQNPIFDILIKINIIKVMSNIRKKKVFFGHLKDIA